MVRFSKSTFGKRDLKEKNHWKSLDFANFNIISPTLICLGGNGTTDSHDAEGVCIKKGEQKINYNCSIAERLMGLQEDKIDMHSSFNKITILGFSYGKNNQNDRVGSFDANEQEIIVNEMLLPLCIDKNGHAYSKQQCCKNFSLLTFFTHCWGAREVGALFQMLEFKLLKYGFSKEDIDYIFSFSAQITYSPFSDQTLVPTFRIDSFTDSLHRGMNKMFQDYYHHKLNGIEITFDKAGYLYGKKSMYTTQPIATLWSSRLINTKENTDLSKIIDEHDIEIINRNSVWGPVNGGANVDAVSQIVGYVMSKRMANSLNCYLNNSLKDYQPLMQIVEEASDLLKLYKPEDYQIIE